MKYDPLIAPDPRVWLDMGEDAQIRSVRDYHMTHAPERLKEDLHAAFHVMIENQLAVEEKPVQATLARLMNEGLDRHEAIHAMSAVLMEHMYDIVHRGSTGDKTKEMYYQDLSHLVASEWKKPRK
jgi:hypothetical protein